MSKSEEPIKVVSFLKLKTGKQADVIKKLQSIEEIVKIESITGEYDLLLEIHTHSTEILYTILTKNVDVIPGIKAVHSNYIMKSWKK